MYFGQVAELSQLTTLVNDAAKVGGALQTGAAIASGQMLSVGDRVLVTKDFSVLDKSTGKPVRVGVERRQLTGEIVKVIRAANGKILYDVKAPRKGSGVSPTFRVTSAEVTKTRAGARLTDWVAISAPRTSHTATTASQAPFIPQAETPAPANPALLIVAGVGVTALAAFLLLRK